MSGPSAEGLPADPPSLDEEEEVRWWHAYPDDRPYANHPGRCRHGVDDPNRWICRAGKVVYHD